MRSYHHLSLLRIDRSYKVGRSHRDTDPLSLPYGKALDARMLPDDASIFGDDLSRLGNSCLVSNELSVLTARHETDLLTVSLIRDS